MNYFNRERIPAWKKMQRMKMNNNPKLMGWGPSHPLRLNYGNGVRAHNIKPLRVRWIEAEPRDKSTKERRRLSPGINNSRSMGGYFLNIYSTSNNSYLSMRSWRITISSQLLMMMHLILTIIPWFISTQSYLYLWVILLVLLLFIFEKE